MTSNTLRALALGAFATLAGTLAACSGGGGPGPIPVTTPKPTATPKASVVITWTGVLKSTGLSTQSAAVKDFVSANDPTAPLLISKPAQYGQFLEGLSTATATATIDPQPSSPPTIAWALTNNLSADALSANDSGGQALPANEQLVSSAPIDGVVAPGISQIVATASGSAITTGTAQVITYLGFGLNCSSTANGIPNGISFGNLGPVTASSPADADLYFSGPSCAGGFQGIGLPTFPHYNQIIAPYGATLVPIGGTSPTFPAVTPSLATVTASTTIDPTTLVSGSNPQGTPLNYLLVKTSKGETVKILIQSGDYVDSILTGVYEVTSAGAFPY